MKEETIKTIANVTGFVAGLAAELVVNTALCAVIPSRTVRTFARKLVATIGVSTTAWVVGCKVSDYVCDAVIGLAEEVEDIKNTVKAKISEAADEVEESDEVANDTEENTKEVDSSENEDEDDVSQVSYFEFAKYADKDVAEKSLSRFIGYLRGFISYDIVTGKVRHFLNLNELKANEIFWAASLVNDFAHVVAIEKEWVLTLPKPVNYRKWREGVLHNG